MVKFLDNLRPSQQQLKIQKPSKLAELCRNQNLYHTKHHRFKSGLQKIERMYL